MYMLKKRDFDRFLSDLLPSYKVIGPRHDNTFGSISTLSDMELHKNPLHSAKHLFLPQGEVMFEFDSAGMIATKGGPKTILFLHPCDANALKVMDMHFLHSPPDTYYSARRENITLFVLQCQKQCSEGSFCATLNTHVYNDYDLLFVEYGDSFIVKVGEGGKGFVRGYFEKREKDYKISIDNKKTIHPVPFDSKAYEKASERCLSCAACTLVCPTCSCFGIFDSISTDMEKGERCREESSCQTLDFTKVAGNFVFRKSRKDRLKHRLLHKLKWFNEEHGIQMCVGCGRCIEACPTKINMLEILKEAQKDESI